MKLSVKVEYACRVLAQLARLHGCGELAHIEKLAKTEAVPANYLVQILSELRGGNLIVSRRGKQGGYALARAPDSRRAFRPTAGRRGRGMTFPSRAATKAA